MLRDMRIANFIGELVSGAVMALAVPLAILAVGMFDRTWRTTNSFRRAVIRA